MGGCIFKHERIKNKIIEKKLQMWHAERLRQILLSVLDAGVDGTCESCFVYCIFSRDGRLKSRLPIPFPLS